VTDLDTKSFEAVIARAAERLVSVRHDTQGSFISTPMMYPSGGAVVVWVDRAAPHYFITDYGFGVRECEIMGADRRQYTRHAAPIAEAAGVELAADGAFQVIASEAQLVGAIKTIAACSLEVAISFANRRQQRERADVRTILVGKLQRLFGEPSVAKEIEFKGASESPWQIDVAVKRGDEFALFETVTPWFPSVASTLAKFGDIKLLDNPPARTSVLSVREGFGSWMTALAQNGNVVQVSATDSTFSRAATLH
jgi:hypothetical protein